ncbi:MAG: radical SAM protein [Myxococcota bacterium]
MNTRTLEPLYCVWELTLACNQRCGHCGSRAGRARPDELDTEECLGVVRSLAKLGCQVITLSGGEPTLRRDWDVIAAEIRAQGMIPNMVTNAFALASEDIRRMKDVPLANVAVSIDGPEDVHDTIRGRGAFARTRRSVERIKDAGLSVTVMTTINRLNLNRLDEMHGMVIELGADKWRHQLGKPMGSMKDNGELVIAPRDLLVLLPKLYELNERGPVPIGIGDSIGYFGPYDSALRATSWRGEPQCWGGCQAGMRAIGIEANGGIKGCLSMQAFSGGPDPFLEGNIRSRSLEEIWYDPNGFAYNRQFSSDRLEGFCRSCRHRVGCRGGARCVAAAVLGHVGEDPYCYHRVATIATRRPAAVARRSVATAASVMSLLFAGCESSGPLSLPSNTTIDCSEVCCDCSYDGDAEPAVAACCEPAVTLDYGVDPEPVDCTTVLPDCDSGQLPADIQTACCKPAAAPEYGVEPPPIDCTGITAQCDAGQLPPDVQVACCEPAVTPDYGVEPDPVDCNTVLPDCDTGQLPADLQATCCEPAVAPEYGVEPDPVDCNNVCCDCDYGILPPGVEEACCAPEPDPVDCSTVCCMCDYGILPPAEAACCDGDGGGDEDGNP